MYQKWIGIWNFTYSWWSYIFRTTWVNHIEYSCSSFFFCNWKKGSGCHKNKSTNKSIYMIHFFTQNRKHKMNSLHVFMLKISFMSIFLQLKKNKKYLHDDQMGAMAPPTSRTSVLCCERPLPSLFLKKLSIIVIGQLCPSVRKLWEMAWTLN